MNEKETINSASQGKIRDKRAKFIEICEKRMTKALKDIRMISNLSNKNLYQYSQQDIQKMVRALEEEVRYMKERFQTQDKNNGVTFKLEK